MKLMVNITHIEKRETINSSLFMIKNKYKSLLQPCGRPLEVVCPPIITPFHGNFTKNLLEESSFLLPVDTLSLTF